MAYDPFWDSLGKLTVEQAAYLWFRLEPQLGFQHRTAKVVHVMTMLDDAINRGELRAYQDSPQYLPGRDDDYTGSRSGGVQNFFVETYVTVEDLRAWAERHGHRPAFLFPEIQPSTKGLDAECALAERLRHLEAGFHRRSSATHSRMDAITAILDEAEKRGGPDLHRMRLDGTRPHFLELCKRLSPKLFGDLGPGRFEELTEGRFNPQKKLEKLADWGSGD